jgi:hypothetical protein
LEVEAAAEPTSDDIQVEPTTGDVRVEPTTDDVQVEGGGSTEG